MEPSQTCGETTSTERKRGFILPDFCLYSFEIFNLSNDFSLNPLSMMEALVGAMKHSAILEKERGGDVEDADRLIEFANKLQKSIHAQVRM